MFNLVDCCYVKGVNEGSVQQFVLLLGNILVQTEQIVELSKNCFAATICIIIEFLKNLLDWLWL